MDIPEESPLPVLPTPRRPLEAPLQPPSELSGVQQQTAAKDTVRLTERGRECKTAMRQAHVAPEIREDRVLALKRRLEEGTYRIMGHRVAANLIDEALENNRALNHIDIST